MNSQQHQQYPFAYGPMQPVEFVFANAQAQQNMQSMPPQCGNMTCMYPPMQQPVAPVPQQYNPYMMQCGYLLPPPFGAHGHHHPLHHYPQPPPPSFFNQAHYPEPQHGMMQPPPSPLGPHHMVPQHQMSPMPEQAHQMNSYSHAQLQSIYQEQATFEAPVMPPPSPNLNFLPNPMDDSTCSTPSASAYPGDDENRKHVFLRGALYNTEFLQPDESPQFMDAKSQSDETDEDPYDPMDEVSRSQSLCRLQCILLYFSQQALPTIYGIRFYNPNFGPEGAIPKKAYARKKADNSKGNEVPFAKPPESFAHGLPQFRGIYPLLPLHRIANADSYGYQAIGAAQDALSASADYSAGELDDDMMPGNMSPKCQGSMSPNSKAKQQRRQGRNRLRGFTQSFGIVAPVKRSNQSAKENMDAAKNVLSLFDTKPLNKKWLMDDWDTADPITGDQTDPDCNAMSQDIRILQRDLPN